MRNAKEAIPYIEQLERDLRNATHNTSQREEIRMSREEWSITRHVRDVCRCGLDPRSLTVTYTLDEREAKRFGDLLDRILMRARGCDERELRAPLDLDLNDHRPLFTERLVMSRAQSDWMLRNRLSNPTTDCSGGINITDETQLAEDPLNPPNSSTTDHIEVWTRWNYLSDAVDSIRERLTSEAVQDFIAPVTATEDQVEAFRANAHIWESVPPLSGEGQMRGVREAEEGASDRPRPERTDEHVGGTE